MRGTVAIIAVLSGACVERDWAGLHANDPTEERTFRGPCVAFRQSADDVIDVPFTYTADSEEMVSAGTNDDGEDYRLATSFHYAADGSYSKIVRSETWPGTTMVFERVGELVEVRTGYPTLHKVAEYDAALFQLRPAAGLDRRVPEPIVGLLRTYMIGELVDTYTWERTATGVRRTDGAGNTFDVELDDRGRIVGYDVEEQSYHLDPRTPTTVTAQYRYRYEGDRLVERRYVHPVREVVERYRYDRGGNLIASAYDTIYRYDCWD